MQMAFEILKMRYCTCISLLNGLLISLSFKIGSLEVFHLKELKIALELNAWNCVELKSPLWNLKGISEGCKNLRCIHAHQKPVSQ